MPHLVSDEHAEHTRKELMRMLSICRYLYNEWPVWKWENW